jgi:PAS domain S-box-containing protein
MKPHVIFILIGMLIVLSGGLMLWAAARRYRKELGLEKESREKAQETGFIISAFHEVTKQLKEKEKELQRLKSLAEQHAENVESYNENVLQCVTSGVMTFDRNCRLSTMNRAAEELLGWKQDRKGMSCRELFFDGDIARAVQATLEKQMPSARLEALLERPEGDLWLGFNTAVLTDRNGAAIGVILSFSDLTQVKRLQEQMELRERLTALGEMSAGIAHELRNPMAVISGYLTLLSKKTDASSQAVIRDIASEINGMNRIIGELLNFARPASLNRVNVNLRDMIEACLASVIQAGGNAARIQTRISVAEMQVSVDEVLMRQAFTNLFQNAIDAMPEGGTLTVEAEAGRHVVIRVADSGKGIPREIRKKIFLPFFTTKDTGTGLGLAMVHKIVLSHGGRIEAESEEGNGSRFTIALPTR